MYDVSIRGLNTGRLHTFILLILNITVYMHALGHRSMVYSGLEYFGKNVLNYLGTKSKLVATACMNDA